MRTYTIGEAAQRSGFSASALRYYEGIGLLEAPTRTAAGYRLYDDGSLARLAFIARAKQLGCSLEEITDLVGIWDGERCGPVQRRFHDLVSDKLAEAERQIAELAALAEQLRRAARRLRAPAVDGPCDARCACAAIEAPVPARAGAAAGGGRPVGPVPLHDATAPIACTATSDQLPLRIEQIERLRSLVHRVERTRDGIVLHLPATTEAHDEVASFVVEESACCAFWGFAVTTTDDRIALRWDGPPAARDLVDELVAFFEGDGPLTALVGNPARRPRPDP